MHDHRPSLTAAFVAACRGLSPILPDDARLVDDPYGLRFGAPPLAPVAALLDGAPRALRFGARVVAAPVLPWVLYMQVRTRAIDDAVIGFVRAGGAQVVILGAGFDARAVRLAAQLRGVSVFEVDHPATQARKRSVLPSSGAKYLAWDFERDPLAELPARIEGIGLDRSRPTLTLWEGVTMYLTAEALSATVDAVADYSSPGSELVFNYLRRDVVERPGFLAGAVSLVVRGVGEPFRSGWHPAELPGWLGARGFTVRSDDAMEALSKRMLPSRLAMLVRPRTRLVVAVREAAAAGALT